jgi:hypothetical protein
MRKHMCVCLVFMWWIVDVNKMVGCLDVMLYLNVMGWGSDTICYNYY